MRDGILVVPSRDVYILSRVFFYYNQEKVMADNSKINFNQELS